MNKVKRFITFLLACAPIITIGNFMLSCSENTTKPFILFKSKSIFTQQKNVILEFTTSSDVTGNELHVDFDQPPHAPINIVSNTIKINNNSGIIEFKISEEVLINASFLFNLKFNFSTQFQTVEHIEYDFSIYYVLNDPMYEDPVSFPNRSSFAIDSHVFNYDMEFFNKPLSNINVSLDAGIFKDILTITKTEFDPEDGLKISIPIVLDMMQHMDNTYFLNLTVSFINSYGKNQQIVFYGCTAQYTKTPSETVPFDYLNLEELPSSKNNDVKYKLLGLKPHINPDEAGHYRNLIIPDNVVEIGMNAFIDKTWFSGIKYLQINNSVEKIGVNCFFGLTNLNEINLKEYEGEPSWKSVKNIFDTDNMKSNFGYVWSNQCENPQVSLNPYIHDWGLPDGWNAYDNAIISQPEWFDLSSDKAVLQGIKPEYIEQIKNCKVIKIPDTVSDINGLPFSVLQNSPYTYVDVDGTKHRQTRRLILGRKLEKCSDKCFKECGFGGPIAFMCENIENIPKSSFENFNNFGNPQLINIETEPTTIEWDDCTKLNSIAEYAFNNIRLINKTLLMPDSLRNIQDYAFQGNEFNKIIFNKHLSSLGHFVFANAFLEPQTPNLSVIDLSMYSEIPSWMTENLSTFDGACIDDDSGQVIFNQELVDSIEDFDEWFDTFKINHHINKKWSSEIKSNNL